MWNSTKMESLWYRQPWWFDLWEIKSEMTANKIHSYILFFRLTSGQVWTHCRSQIDFSEFFGSGPRSLHCDITQKFTLDKVTFSFFTCIEHNLYHSLHNLRYHNISPSSGGTNSFGKISTSSKSSCTRRSDRRRRISRNNKSSSSSSKISNSSRSSMNYSNKMNKTDIIKSTLKGVTRVVVVSGIETVWV